jgi:RNA-binding protein YhbY
LLFEEFRNITNESYSLHEEHQHYQQSRSDYLKTLLNIGRECNLLKEIKDALDEIKMIKAVLTEQLNVLKFSCFSKILPELYSTVFTVAMTKEKSEDQSEARPNTTPGGAFSEAKQLLEDIMHNFDVIGNHASAVEKGVDSHTVTF